MTANKSFRPGQIVSYRHDLLALDIRAHVERVTSKHVVIRFADPQLVGDMAHMQGAKRALTHKAAERLQRPAREEPRQ